MANFSIYQIIHTLDGKIYHLEAHLTLLFEGYYQLFNSGVKLDHNDIRRQIEDLLRRSRCPRGVSSFIKITLSEGGHLELEESERSLYRGYTLRCISPRATIIDFNLPYVDYPTTMRHHLTQWANHVARRQGYDLALRSHNEEIDLANGAQLFGVLPRGVVTSAHSFSVEHKLAKELAQKIDLNIIERPILFGELGELEELFFVDHYGVTSIRSCNHRHYMSITAGALAAQLEGITAQ